MRECLIYLLVNTLFSEYSNSTITKEQRGEVNFTLTNRLFIIQSIGSKIGAPSKARLMKNIAGDA